MIAQNLVHAAPVANSNMLKSLFEHSPSAMVIADTDRNIIDVNASFSRMFLIERSDTQRMQVQELYADKSEFERIRTKVRSGLDRLGSKFYATYQRSDGTVFPGQASLTELFSDDGQIIGVAGIINDLTDISGDDVELMLGIERLAAERSRQSALYMRSPAMMHSIDENGFIETVSQAWLHRFGFSEPEVIGRRSTDFLTLQSKEHALQVVLPEFWKTGRCDRVPYTFVCKDGSTVEIELSAVLDRTQGRPVTLAVLEDVSDRNASRRALEQRNQDLRDFAHVVAHDLQAPIRHVSVFTRMLRGDLEDRDADAIEDSLQIIESSAITLTELIRSLLEFSVSGKAGIIAIEQDAVLMIQDVRKIYAGEIAERGATVEVSTMPTIRCDRALMLRVFSNLIGNALKYVAPGVAPEIVVSAKDLGDAVLMRFCDNGIGIPKAYRSQVFQPLKRLHGSDSDYSGTGIGLALCQRIVEAHGGTIAVGDAGPVGTVIEVTLPK